MKETSRQELASAMNHQHRDPVRARANCRRRCVAPHPTDVAALSRRARRRVPGWSTPMSRSSSPSLAAVALGLCAAMGPGCAHPRPDPAGAERPAIIRAEPGMGLVNADDRARLALLAARRAAASIDDGYRI